MTRLSELSIHFLDVQARVYGRAQLLILVLGYKPIKSDAWDCFVRLVGILQRWFFKIRSTKRVWKQRVVGNDRI